MKRRGRGLPRKDVYKRQIEDGLLVQANSLEELANVMGLAPEAIETFLAIAIGNPLGVFVQMAFQIPALKKVGIRLRPRICLLYTSRCV